MGAQQLQVLDVVLAADALGDDVVDLKVAERELAPASVAPALLLAEQGMLVLAGMAPARRCRCGQFEQVAQGLLQGDVDQLNGLG